MFLRLEVSYFLHEPVTGVTKTAFSFHDKGVTASHDLSLLPGLMASRIGSAPKYCSQFADRKVHSSQKAIAGVAIPQRPIKPRMIHFFTGVVGHESITSTFISWG